MDGSGREEGGKKEGRREGDGEGREVEGRERELRIKSENTFGSETLVNRPQFSRVDKMKVITTFFLSLPPFFFLFFYHLFHVFTSFFSYFTTFFISSYIFATFISFFASLPTFLTSTPHFFPFLILSLSQSCLRSKNSTISLAQRMNI